MRNAYPDIRAFHRAWGEATPLRELPGGLWLKDESNRFGLNAYKILGASWALHRLDEVRQLRAKKATIATATSGNHGRGVAHAARRMGLECVVYISAAANPIRVARIAGEGARIVRIEGNYDDSVRACIADAELGGWHLVQDLIKGEYSEIPNWIIDGYSTLYAEAEEQLPRPIENVFLHMGAGNLAEAGLRHWMGRARIAVARPNAEATLADCLILDEPSEGLLASGVDERIATTDADAREAVEWLASLGVRSSESGAGGVAGWIRAGRPRGSFAVLSEGPLE